MFTEESAKKTTQAEYERAFAELAIFLYEQYRKQKLTEAINPTNVD